MPATTVSFHKSSLSLEGAQQVLEAGIANARDAGVPVAIGIVDESGRLKAFCRMDDAGLIASEVAINKAYTAAATGALTSGVHEFISSDAGALLSMPHLPDFTVVAGGVPLVVDGAVVGAVGVSGGPVAVDNDIADAAAGALAGG